MTFLSFRDGPKDRPRNLEIPGLRFAHPGMTDRSEIGWHKPSDSPKLGS
jgi:hypothetical protein